MKKRYLPKQKDTKELVLGAYDKDGHWWFEDDIKLFTAGMVERCFNMKKNDIKLVLKKPNTKEDKK